MGFILPVQKQRTGLNHEQILSLSSKLGKFGYVYKSTKEKHQSTGNLLILMRH
jgi:hypothetical protein